MIYASNALAVGLPRGIMGRVIEGISSPTTTMAFSHDGALALVALLSGGGDKLAGKPDILKIHRDAWVSTSETGMQAGTRGLYETFESQREEIMGGFERDREILTELLVIIPEGSQLNTALQEARQACYFNSEQFQYPGRAQFMPLRPTPSLTRVKYEQILLFAATKLTHPLKQEIDRIGHTIAELEKDREAYQTSRATLQGRALYIEEVVAPIETNLARVTDEIKTLNKKRNELIAQFVSQ